MKKPEIDLKAYFLPYQIKWINDPSRLKIWRKSRRIGATYGEAYIKVRKCVQTPGHAVWHSSADESAAKEFIQYCQTWAKVFKKAGELLSVQEEIVDEKEAIRALVLRFVNGARIVGLSSSPTAFRSKGGDVDLDEFDWHEDQRALYAAAKPCITWGFDLTILSTYKSKSGLYHQFIEETEKAIREGRKPVFSLHTTTIFEAVEQGLLDKIYGRPTTLSEREAWIKVEKDSCGDEDIWLQEYCCTPVDESEAFLTWDMIRACEHAQAGVPKLSGNGEFYVGMDIGRRRDLTVIWVLEKIGDVLWTREVVRMKNASFASQDDELDRVYKQYKPRRMRIDQTGMGEKPVEDAQRKYGEYTVEGVVFTLALKQEIAYLVKRKIEDKLLRMPIDEDSRKAHHAVKKITTASGNIRFDAERTDKGHVDEFWAHGLAVSAADQPGGKPEYESVGARKMAITGAY